MCYAWTGPQVSVGAAAYQGEPLEYPKGFWDCFGAIEEFRGFIKKHIIAVMPKLLLKLQDFRKHAKLSNMSLKRIARVAGQLTPGVLCYDWDVPLGAIAAAANPVDREEFPITCSGGASALSKAHSPRA